MSHVPRDSLDKPARPARACPYMGDEGVARRRREDERSAMNAIVAVEEPQMRELDENREPSISGRGVAGLRILNERVLRW